ncbi:MAG TPA: protein kinase [Acidimicrobiales bacterium]|nr:protein kinase [Acidimicrobiales bacterium]
MGKGTETETDSATGAQADRVLAGRYRLLRLIASGGMAEVWEGRDLVLARPVAVKLPLAHLARQEQAMRRFHREAVAAAGLSHPNVVAVYDTGTDGSDSFIVMERVVGASLARLLAEEGPLAVDRAVSIAAQVGAALDFACRSGVVHRDVKPANVLVTADGVAKVTDFGIAKALQGEDTTRADTAMGTARYAAPEQVDGRAPDGRTDVYGLGVVLYELLCGQVPFAGDTDVAVAFQHLHEAPVPPSRLRPETPAWLEQVVLRALAKDPAERFESPGAMRAALVRGGDARSSTGAPSGGGGHREVPTRSWEEGPATATLSGTGDLRAWSPRGAPGPPTVPWQEPAPTAAATTAGASTGSDRVDVAGRQGRTLPWVVAGIVLGALIVVAVIGLKVQHQAGRPSAAVVPLATTAASMPGPGPGATWP